MINSGDLWIYTDFIKAMIELHHDNYYSHSELSYDDIFIVIERVEHAHGNYIKILCKSCLILDVSFDKTEEFVIPQYKILTSMGEFYIWEYNIVIDS